MLWQQPDMTHLLAIFHLVQDHPKINYCSLGTLSVFSQMSVNYLRMSQLSLPPGSCYYILQAASERTTSEALARRRLCNDRNSCGCILLCGSIQYSDLKCLTVRSLFWLLRLIRRNDAPWRCLQQRCVGPPPDPSATCTVLC